MNSLLQPKNPSISRDDLEDAGFTADQIRTLEELRANYPYVEFLDSRKELERLRFMKWMLGRKPASSS